MSVVIHAIVKVERTQKCAIGSRKAVQMAVKCVVCEGSSPPTLSNLSLYSILVLSAPAPDLPRPSPCAEPRACPATVEMSDHPRLKLSIVGLPALLVSDSVAVSRGSCAAARIVS